MLVISSREFRENQKGYFNKIDEGVEILIQRGKNRSYKIIPIPNDGTLMSEEEFFAKIDRSVQQAKEGKVTKIKSAEELRKFLHSL
ncbi:MAG: prevent-host-death protein [Dysgonamonadaceae bacterium]|jgi:hypothetical protein|nr:prevent-host-death protein [Dysgonamonadaceae bacterium]